MDLTISMFSTQAEYWKARADLAEATVRETASALGCKPDNEAMLAAAQDAERYRHCKAHGHPMTGPQCLAWTYDGRMVFGATPEEALDNAIAHRV